jgi:hypothetical protein
MGILEARGQGKSNERPSSNDCAPPDECEAQCAREREWTYLDLALLAANAAVSRFLMGPAALGVFIVVH